MQFCILCLNVFLKTTRFFGILCYVRYFYILVVAQKHWGLIVILNKSVPTNAPYFTLMSQQNTAIFDNKRSVRFCVILYIARAAKVVAVKQSLAHFWQLMAGQPMLQFQKEQLHDKIHAWLNPSQVCTPFRHQSLYCVNVNATIFPTKY